MCRFDLSILLSTNGVMQFSAAVSAAQRKVFDSHCFGFE
jgi:hypothetical protein